ncbi:hypothetical protein [Ferdinandcohnia sp. SAFN-114]|uniref:hypothetical protein n=1 Tax=Ferdinandcohnia sp. SAFN-114 TaxID=3387275 RepID=UPI003F7E22F0
MIFTEDQRKVFTELKENMLAATSPEEVKLYTNQIHELLDLIEKESPNPKMAMPKEIRKEYEKLIVHLQDATSSKEVLYYENKIHGLLDRLEQK